MHKRITNRRILSATELAAATGGYTLTYDLSGYLSTEDRTFSTLDNTSKVRHEAAMTEIRDIK
jgi:hypothetical protein